MFRFPSSTPAVFVGKKSASVALFAMDEPWQQLPTGKMACVDVSPGDVWM